MNFSLFPAAYGSAPPGAIGDEGFVTSPVMDSPLSPQDTHSFVPYLHTTAHVCTCTCMYTMYVYISVCIHVYI